MIWYTRASCALTATPVLLWLSLFLMISRCACPVGAQSLVPGCRGDSSKLSKSDRKASKRAAADVLATMNGASGRCETITLPKRGRIVLDTLALRVLYRFLCGALGSAAQAHLQHNPAVAGLLGLSDDADGRDGDGGGGSGGTKAWRGGSKQQRAVQERARHKASSARMAAHMMPQHDEA